MPPRKARGRKRRSWGGLRKKKVDDKDDNNKNLETNVEEDEEMNEEEEESEDLKDSGDTSQSDNNMDESKAEQEEGEGVEDEGNKKEEEELPKKRGRKRKSEQPPPPPQEEKSTPDLSKRGIIASGGSLRRRDTLKTTTRYSPPPVTNRKQKLDKSNTTGGDSSDLNDSSTSKVEKTGAGRPGRKPSASKISTTNNTVMENSNKRIKTEQNDKEFQGVAATLSDGLSNAERSQEQQQQQNKSEEMKRKTDETSSVEESTDNNKLKSTRILRRKSIETANNQNEVQNVTGATKVIIADKSKSPVRVVLTEKVAGITTTPTKTYSNLQTIHIRRSTASLSSPSSSSITATTPVKESKNTLVIPATNSTVTNSTSTVSENNQISEKISNVDPTVSSSISTEVPIKTPTILKPSPIASTPVPKVPRKSIQLNKYLDTLPEIQDCIHNDGIPDSDMDKMPDKILLVNSELPIPLSVSMENANENYLFTQIISPVNSLCYVCLLCKGIDVNYATKEEKDILLHYQSLHELDVDIGQAKFSQEVVYICLPKMILNQFHNTTNLSLNSPCQYCEQRLGDIEEMKEHYKAEHGKSVVMMEQEEIMQMHHFFYCSICKERSGDFDTHHKHMKEKHNLKTYRCKSCVLVTKDENRLRTHYKAKHMLHTAGQNYQCYYCHGLLIGVERLQKHIQQSHMVQTGESDFSCVACRQSCGKGKELLTHAQNCSLAGSKPEKTDARYVPVLEIPTDLTEDERLCYFCHVKLESEEAYQLHLHHEHKIWVPTAQSNVTNDSDKLIENNDESHKLTMLTIDDVISDEDLERAKIKTYVGHWCRICDQMVKVYQLFYLHMINFHKYEKKYQCVITNCKKTFEEFPEFMQHIEETGHPQKTIITHPDEVYVCSYCDIYFSTDEELTEHLITDSHINKFTASGHFHRTEPRNFKCKACHTFFGMKESYIHHLETESHQYVCTYCGITTATPSSRRAHIQNSHATKLSQCEDCGEIAEDMLAHFVVHGYTFECKKCIKKFYNRERLNAHMEVHLDAVECNFPDCTRMIATRSMLVTHYRSHKSEHKCNVCGQAFWNFAMLTSHQRSHQPMPRPPQLSNRGNQLNKATIQYANQATRLTPGVLQRKTPNQPLLANSVIKCGHCNNLYRSSKELAAHNCASKLNPVNNGNKSNLKLISVTNQPQAKIVSKSIVQRRRASPKKPNQQQQNQLSMDRPVLDLVHLQHPMGDQIEGDTQLIMILNQNTGELMEITAPKNMEVSDVINSLDFAPAMAGVRLESIDGSQIQLQQSMPMELDDSNDTNDTLVTTTTTNIVVKDKDAPVDQEETAAAIEMMEQVSEQISDASSNVTVVGPVVTQTIVDSSAVGTIVESSVVETVDNIAETIVTSSVETPIITTESTITEEQVAIPMEHEQQQHESTEIVEETDGEHLSAEQESANPEHSAIVLPPGCINEDGTVTIDAETLQRLNLNISVDENGTITTQEGSTTFIIDTSSLKQQ